MNPPTRSQPIRLAITGGIASGKSLVSGFLVEQGIPLIDTDAVVHDLLKHDEQLLAELRTAFGEDIFDTQGQVDRKALGQVVFGDDAKRKQLESVIHPKVRQACQAFVTENQNHALVAVVIPLLFETGTPQQFDAVWLVSVPEKVQVERLVANRGLTEADAMARINSQMRDAEKRQQLTTLPSSIQTAVIENAGAIEATRHQVAQLLMTLGV